MTPDDLAQTHAAAFTQTQPWSADSFAALVNTKGVILCGDRRSFVLARLTLDELEILTVATDRAFQRQGLAAAALEACERQAIQSGATQAFLEVAADNNTAKALYIKMNFRTIGRRPKYYARPNARPVDAIVMRKQLTIAPQPGSLASGLNS